MIRPLSVPLFLCASAVAGFGAADSVEVNAWAKEYNPPNPEAGGLRLEVNAHLRDAVQGSGKEWTWGEASLNVEVALHNVSAEPITVATTDRDEKPLGMREEPGLGHIGLLIRPDRFQGKPTAFVAARFTPVVLAPDEYVLLLNHRVTIKDRERADALKEVSVAFLVSRDFAGPKEWWRGNLVTYATIQRGTSADQQIAEHKANKKKYDAQREAEKDPNYGATNAARMAALIASADEVNIRGEGEKEADGVVVRDLAWIRGVSEAVAATSLPRTVHCFCIGWRTASFRKNGERVISVAAIHGNQLRIHWDGGGGDYEVSEADWTTVKQALELPGTL